MNKRTSSSGTMAAVRLEDHEPITQPSPRPVTLPCPSGPEEDELPSWASAVGYLPCSEEEATHLVVGTGEILLGKIGAGVLAYCDNEFLAYRCRREILKDPRAEAMVLPNSQETRESVAQVLQGILKEDEGL